MQGLPRPVPVRKQVTGRVPSQRWTRIGDYHDHRTPPLSRLRSGRCAARWGPCQHIRPRRGLLRPGCASAEPEEPAQVAGLHGNRERSCKALRGMRVLHRDRRRLRAVRDAQRCSECGCYMRVLRAAAEKLIASAQAALECCRSYLLFLKLVASGSVPRLHRSTVLLYNPVAAAMPACVQVPQDGNQLQSRSGSARSSRRRWRAKRCRSSRTRRPVRRRSAIFAERGSARSRMCRTRRAANDDTPGTGAGRHEYVACRSYERTGCHI
jgi:hypothetical protein